MIDEEKKAIESLIEIREFANLSSYRDIKTNQLNAIDVVLNLIEKQQENYQSCMDYADSLNKDIGELLLKLEKQDKIINEMADRLEFVMKNSGIGLDSEHGMNFTINDIKEYFKKKVEGENENN